MTPFRLFLVALLLALVLPFSACDSDDDDDDLINPDPDPATVVEIALSDDDFETLVTALTAADLVATLEGAGPFTVFAPTDDAFDGLPDGELDRLLEPENEAELADVLLYHVLTQEATAAALSDGLTLTTAEGASFTVVVSATAASGFGIDTDADGTADADIVGTDLTADNGVVHVIDAVLLPDGGTDDDPDDEEEDG